MLTHVIHIVFILISIMLNCTRIINFILFKVLRVLSSIILYVGIKIKFAIHSSNLLPWVGVRHRPSSVANVLSFFSKTSGQIFTKFGTLHLLGRKHKIVNFMTPTQKEDNFEVKRVKFM